MSGLPRASVQTVLRETGVPPGDISVVVVATRDATYAEGVGGTARTPWLYRLGTSIASPAPVAQKIRESFALERRRRVDEALRSEYGIASPIRFLDHHLVHAVGAACVLGRADCLVVTMDGGADAGWARVIAFEEGRPRTLGVQPGRASLLGYLDAVCDHLGIAEGLDRWRRLEDLAVKGTRVHAEQLGSWIRWKENLLSLDAGLFRPGGIHDRLTGFARKEDVAASALASASDAVTRFVRYWSERHGAETIVLSGDLFEIPAITRAVLAAGTAPEIMAPTAPGDVGLPVGAAFAGCLPEVLENPLPAPRDPLRTPFLGISYDDEPIEGELLRQSAPYHFHPEIERDVARVLAEGMSVARFDGKAEIGNRGLGNRAVLRTPRGPLRQGRLGFVLAPGAYHAIVTADAFDELFDPEEVLRGPLSQNPVLVSPTADFAAACPDLVGWEGRVRVQIVDPESNPRLHGILEEFSTWSGLACLAAAPFRLPDEPLVSSPRDALRTFRLLGTDYAALGRFLVKNPSAPDAPTTTRMPHRRRVRS